MRLKVEWILNCRPMPRKGNLLIKTNDDATSFIRKPTKDLIGRDLGELLY